MAQLRPEWLYLHLRGRGRVGLLPLFLFPIVKHIAIYLPRLWDLLNQPKTRFFLKNFTFTTGWYSLDSLKLKTFVTITIQYDKALYICTRAIIYQSDEENSQKQPLVQRALNLPLVLKGLEDTQHLQLETVSAAN